MPLECGCTIDFSRSASSIGVLAACSGGTTSSAPGPGDGGGGTDGGGGGDARTRTGTCSGSLSLSLSGSALGATVSFELAATGSFCTGSPGTCDLTWLTIVDGAGKSFTYGNPCAPTSGECKQVGCPAICPQPSPVPSEGAKLSWDGRIFTTDTCDGADGRISCFDLDCAPSGQDRITARFGARARRSLRKRCLRSSSSITARRFSARSLRRCAWTPGSRRRPSRRTKP